jgi:PAS domain S-box-containing protein
VTVLYLGPRPERAAALEAQLRSEQIDYAVETADSVDQAVAMAEDGQLAALVAETGIGEAEAAVLTAVDRCLDAQPDLLTLLVAGEESPSVVDRAYRVGVDELVQASGDAALRVIQQELERHVAGERSADDLAFDAHARSITETVSDAIVSIDENSVIRYANPAVEELFGYEPSSLVGEPITVLMRDDLAERHRAGLTEYLETGERSLDWDGVELTGQRKDGSEVQLSVSFSAFTVDSTRHFSGVMRDVSERKRIDAERELYHDVTQRILQAESFEDGLRTAVGAIGTAMNWEYGEAWVRSDDEDHLERVGEPYAATEVAEQFGETTSPIAFDRDEGLLGDVWASESYRWVTDVTDDAVGFGRDEEASRAGFGAALAVPIVSEGTVVAVMLFVLGEAGDPDEAMVGATRTVAADLGHLMKRLQAESRHREERRLKDRILETSPVGIVILEPDGTFSYVNDRASSILGLSEFDGPITDESLDVEALTFGGEPVDDSDPPQRRVIEDGEEIAGEASIEVGGETRWLAVNGAPLRGEDGSVRSAVFSLRDITDRRARERQLRQYGTVMQTVSDGVYALDDEGRFVMVNDAYLDLVGYDRSELLGEPAREFVPNQIVDEADALQEQLEADGLDEVTLEATVHTADGEAVPVETRIVSFDYADGTTGRAGVVRDITRQRRREERLAELSRVAQSLITAESRDEVADVVVDSASELLQLPLTTLEYYDEEAGELHPGARTDALRERVGEAPVFDPEADPAWDAFSTGEERIIHDLSAAPDADGSPFESAIVVPVGGHGVFVAGATAPEAFSDTDVEVARILVGNTLAALERVDREQALREQKAALREHNESLTRVNRVNTIIRNLTRRLTGASTREEIETAVCEELSGASPYVFAWIGEKRAVSDEIVPRASAGESDGYLDAVTITATEGETAQGPAGKAYTSQQPAVQNNLQSDPPFEPWRSAALAREFRSSISVPLTYRDTMYGLLNLYADETGVFDEMEVAVLTELGEMIGYAINAIERKKALVSDTAVELVFELDDHSVPAIQFAAEHDASFEFETFVEQSDGTLRVFFTVVGAAPDTVQGFADRAPTVESVSLLGELDEGYRYEAVTSSKSGFLGELLSYGAHPTAMSVNGSNGRLTVEFPQSGDIKAFTRMFTGRYEGAELVSRTQLDRAVQTRDEFEATYKERLTERQREVIKTAYFSGFFNWPRDISGTELAEKLGVSQPTVSRHIRSGERKLFDAVFEGEDW